MAHNYLIGYHIIILNASWTIKFALEYILYAIVMQKPVVDKTEVEI